MSTGNLTDEEIEEMLERTNESLRGFEWEDRSQEKHRLLDLRNRLVDLQRKRKQGSATPVGPSLFTHGGLR